jgi:hypothetical protein
MSDSKYSNYKQVSPHSDLVRGALGVLVGGEHSQDRAKLRAKRQPAPAIVYQGRSRGGLGAGDGNRIRRRHKVNP